MALNRVLFSYKNMTHNVMKRTPAELFFTRKVEHWLDRLIPDPRRQKRETRDEEKEYRRRFKH